MQDRGHFRNQGPAKDPTKRDIEGLKVGYPPWMTSSLARWAFALVGLADLILGLGFYTQAPWAMALWPWSQEKLDLALLSSFLIAGAGSVLWIAWSAEWGAMVGALLDVAVFNGGTALWLWSRGETVPAVVFTGMGVGVLATLGAVWKIPIRDVRPADRLLKGSFWIFMVALLLAGGGMLLHHPVLPWPISPESSTLFGFLFFGSAFYFAWGLYRPSWHNMKGQLIAFLLYDLVLTQPYLDMGYQDSDSLNWNSLIIYWTVILYSSGLALFYLFFSGRTKDWKVVEA